MNSDRLLYLLDTNVCIVYLKGKSFNVNQRLRSLKRNNIAVCSVVKAELFYGSMRSNNPKKALQVQKAFVEQFVSFPFCDRCVFIYGKLRAKLASAGTPIGSNDLLIASIALANDLILVTHNVKEFNRVQGLKIEDWESNEDKL